MTHVRSSLQATEDIPGRGHGGDGEVWPEIGALAPGPLGVAEYFSMFERPRSFWQNN